MVVQESEKRRFVVQFRVCSVQNPHDGVYTRAKVFGLGDVLGESEWAKAIRLEE